MKRIILLIAAAVVLAVVGLAAADYVTKIYKDQGGDRMVVADGGEVLVEGNGTLTMDSNSTLAVSQGAFMDFYGYSYSALPSYDNATHTGVMLYCTDCTAGAPGMIYGNGTSWNRVDTPGTAANDS